MLAVSAPTLARAQPNEQRLTRALTLYDDGRYQEALALFDGLCRQTSLPKPQRLSCLKHQAFALYLLSMPEAAKTAWLALLELEPTFDLDPRFEAPEFIAFFQRVRATAARVEADDATPPPAPELAPSVSAPQELPPELAMRSTVRGCGTALCFVPFGVGQFANDRPIKGALLAAVQVGALATNLSLYWSRVYDFERRGYIADVDGVERSLLLQRVALVTLIASVGVGIADALLWP